MLYDLTTYSTILLVFFSQGLVFSYLLLLRAKQDDNPSSFWLGGFIVLCSIYILPWMLGYASWYAFEPYKTFMLYFPFQQLLFLGPVIYFYTESLLNPKFQFAQNKVGHFIPGILYILFSIWMWIYDRFIADTRYYYEDGRDRELDDWYQIIGLISMGYYCVRSILVYNAYRKTIFDKVSFANNILFTWIKKYLILFLFIQILRIIFFVLFPEWGSFNQKGWYYLGFSLFFYYLALKGLLMNFKTVQTYQNAIHEESKLLKKDDNKNNNSIEIEYWKSKILQLVKEEEQFKNQELTLLDVAKALNTNTSLISGVINSGFGMNFNDYINHCRIEGFKEMITDGKNKNTTILGLAYDCGFNSKSTFNRSFKKAEGQTPKEFLDALKIKEKISAKS